MRAAFCKWEFPAEWPEADSGRWRGPLSPPTERFKGSQPLLNVGRCGEPNLRIKIKDEQEKIKKYEFHYVSKVSKKCKKFH